MRKIMINLLLISFVFSGFIQKWYLPIGCAGGSSGKILVADTDRDGCYEIFISDFQFIDKINICELHLPNTWEMDSFTNTGEQVAWDIGDFDCDGLWDLLLWGNVAEGTPPTIFFVTESSDSFSYPINEVWRDTVGPATFIADEAFDIDQDGYPELVKNCPEPYGNIGIYEYISDNQYSLIFTDTTNYGSPLATHAFGDFDQDGHNEVVFAGADNTYWIYESPANNTYERVRFDTLPTHNIRDCFEVPDMDGDGKWEFVLKGSSVSGPIDAFIFEATGDNTYDTIKVFHFPGGDYYGGHSDAGDVDGDSIPEIVLEARQNVFIIKAAGNDSFYVWETLPGNGAGLNIKIFDLDNNGLNDIIMSGAQQTWIYEYESGWIAEARSEPQETKLELIPNPVKGVLKLRLNPLVESHVKIGLYDVTGRFVKNIFKDQTKTGLIELSVLTKGLTNGVYFVRITVGNEEITKKIIILE
jgi:hypothetical protein